MDETIAGLTGHELRPVASHDTSRSAQCRPAAACRRLLPPAPCAGLAVHLPKPEVIRAAAFEPPGITNEVAVVSRAWRLRVAMGEKEGLDRSAVDWTEIRAIW